MPFSSEQSYLSFMSYMLLAFDAKVTSRYCKLYISASYKVQSTEEMDGYVLNYNYVVKQ